MISAPGSIDEIWNRRYQFDGMFKYQDFEWTHITSDDLGNPGDIVAVAQDPNKSGRVWATAWGTGILEIEDDKIKTVWDEKVFWLGK